ncbi:urease accessory protein UreD [Arthrobacter sp. Hiyo4]|nr:urease accessory protein UreD [Arthrobacter sp. Hiyo4]
MTGAPAPELPVRRAAVELAGTLALTVGVRGGRCIATSQYHQGALRILRPHYLDDTGQVCYVVVNPGVDTSVATSMKSTYLWKQGPGSC